MVFTMVCFCPMMALPLARQALMIMGSIAGVSPTATDRANKRAVSQSPLVTPQAAKTTGTNTSINRINTRAMELAPALNPSVRRGRAAAKPPYTVSRPTASTTPAPVPPITAEPIKAMLLYSAASLMVSVIF